MTPLRAASIGLICFAIGGAVGAFIAGRYHAGPPPTDINIVFPIKVYTDTGTFVSITGRLAGQGIGYKNNVETISCYRQSNECQLQDIEQIGPNQISSLSPSISLPVTQWDDDVIIASNVGESDPVSCSHTTINIDRKKEFALWVQQPTNQTSLHCKDADEKTYKWTIERSLWEEQPLAKQ